MRRTHSKIEKLPADLKAAVDQLLSSGFTYEEIATEIQSRGHDVTKSTVGRYAKTCMKVVENMRKAHAVGEGIASVSKDQPNLDIASGATQLALMEILDYLTTTEIKEDPELRAKCIAMVSTATAQLQRSQTMSEKYRMEWLDKAKKVKLEIEAAAKDDGLTQEKIDRIFQKLTGV